MRAIYSSQRPLHIYYFGKSDRAKNKVLHASPVICTVYILNILHGP